MNDAEIKNSKITEQLQSVELFSELNSDQLYRLAKTGIIEPHKRNDFIFKQGEEGTKFYVVISGAIRVSRTVTGIGEEAFAILRKAFAST